MYELNQALHQNLDEQTFSANLLRDLARLEQLAGELFGAAVADEPTIDVSRMNGITPIPPAQATLLATVLPRLCAQQKNGAVAGA
jgi:hypothetical protein